MSSKLSPHVIAAALTVLVLGCGSGSDSSSTDAAETTGNGTVAASADAADTEALEKAAADFAAKIESEINAGAGERMWHFGQSDVECETITADLLNANPADFADVKVRVKGKVAAVCQARGCWVQVEDTSGEKIFAKSFDHLVLMPKNCEGMAIDVVGTMYADPVEEGEEQTYSFSLDGATLVSAADTSADG